MGLSQLKARGGLRADTADSREPRVQVRGDLFHLWVRRAGARSVAGRRKGGAGVEQERAAHRLGRFALLLLRRAELSEGLAGSFVRPLRRVPVPEATGGESGAAAEEACCCHPSTVADGAKLIQVLLIRCRRGEDGVSNGVMIPKLLAQLICQRLSV